MARLRGEPRALSKVSGVREAHLDGLTAGERRFVLMMFELPGVWPIEVARACGYGGKSGARVAAWRFMRNPAVREAIKAETVRRIDGTLPEAFSVVVDLMRSAKDDAVRLRAAAKVLAYRGISEVQRVEVEHRVPTLDETLEEIRRAARALGISEEKALGSLTDVEVKLERREDGSFGERPA